MWCYTGMPDDIMWCVTLGCQMTLCGVLQMPRRPARLVALITDSSADSKTYEATA